MTLQETPGSVPPGRLPRLDFIYLLIDLFLFHKVIIILNRHRDLILLGDLIDCARPGEEIVFFSFLFFLCFKLNIFFFENNNRRSQEFIKIILMHQLIQKMDSLSFQPLLKSIMFQKKKIYLQVLN